MQSGVLRVVLVKRELDATDHVETQVGVVAGERAHVTDLEVADRAVAVCRLGVVVC